MGLLLLRLLLMLVRRLLLGRMQRHETLRHATRLLVDGPQRGQLLRVAFLQVAQLVHAAVAVVVRRHRAQHRRTMRRMIRKTSGRLLHRRQVAKVLHGAGDVDGRPRSRSVGSVQAAAAAADAAR